MVNNDYLYRKDCSIIYCETFHFSSDMVPGSGQRQLTIDDVTNQGRYLLNDFIHERLQSDGIENVPGMEVLQEPGTPRGNGSASEKY